MVTWYVSCDPKRILKEVNRVKKEIGESQRTRFHYVAALHFPFFIVMMIAERIDWSAYAFIKSSQRESKFVYVQTARRESIIFSLRVPRDQLRAGFTPKTIRLLRPNCKVEP